MIIPREMHTGTQVVVISAMSEVPFSKRKEREKYQKLQNIARPIDGYVLWTLMTRYRARTDFGRVIYELHCVLRARGL